MSDPREATPPPEGAPARGADEAARPSLTAGVPFLAPTPRSLRVVPAPAERRPTPPFVPRDRITAPAASLGPGSPGRSEQPAAPPGAEPPLGASPLDDADAWDWGHEPVMPEPFAPTLPTPAGTIGAVAGGSTAAAPDTSERAAAVLESLATRLRQRALVLDAAAAVDSDEAVLASTLAALFARRPR